MSIELFAVTLLAALVGVGGVVINDRDYGWQKAAHYWPVAAVISGLAPWIWYGQTVRFSGAVVFFYLVLGAMILAGRYWQNTEQSRWIYRSTPGWAFFGWPIVWLLGMVLSALFAPVAGLAGWIWNINPDNLGSILLVFGPILIIGMVLAALAARWYDQWQDGRNNGSDSAS